MRTVPVHKSLHRRILVLGGEKDLVQMAAFITFLLVIGGMTVLSTIAGLTFWFCALFLLQRMAKADPHMSDIAARHIRQQGFYAAHSAPWRK